MVLVGFGENLKDYRLNDSSRNNGRTVISRNVVIVENKSEENKIIVTDIIQDANQAEMDKPDSVIQKEEEFDEQHELL